MATAQVNSTYYALRANEYDATSSYQRAESRAALAPMKAQYQLAFQGADVLEIACGTGFWTRIVAATALSVTATDLNAEVIAVARAGSAHLDNVRFCEADAFNLADVGGTFTGAFAQFWWSHIPIADIRRFLTSLHGRLVPGARVMFLDTLQYKDRAQQRVDEAGDLLEPRKLRDGTAYEIIKNVPNEAAMRAALADFADEVTFRHYALPGWWHVSYRAKG